MYYTFVTTPAGRLLFVGDGTTVTGIHWEVFARRPAIAPDWVKNKQVFEPVLRQFDEYFAGTRTAFAFAHEARGTDFQTAVWRELEKISYGDRSSYQAIAAAIGQPRAVRAVGTAVGSNPLSIVVPCHRVLTSAGTLGGYAGGLVSKQYLLKREGISFFSAEKARR